MLTDASLHAATAQRAYASVHRQRTWAEHRIIDDMSPTPQAPTFIAILDLRTSPADRPMVQSQLESERPTVRAMPGCIDFRVYTTSECNTDVTVVHEWVDAAAFAGYLQSDAFERSGIRLRPLLTEPPVSRRFRVELIESVH